MWVVSYHITHIRLFEISAGAAIPKIHLLLGEGSFVRTITLSVNHKYVLTQKLDLPSFLIPIFFRRCHDNLNAQLLKCGQITLGNFIVCDEGMQTVCRADADDGI